MLPAIPSASSVPKITENFTNGVQHDPSIAFCQLPATLAPILSTSPSWTGTLEYINDSGAGRPIYSKSALRDQGLPEIVLSKCLGKASQTINFVTGRGNHIADKTIGMTSPLLEIRECYEMSESPFAVSLGQTVEEGNKPFIWQPGQKPYHVTNASKLKI